MSIERRSRCARCDNPFSVQTGSSTVPLCKPCVLKEFWQEMEIKGQKSVQKSGSYLSAVPRPMTLACQTECVAEPFSTLHTLPPFSRSTSSIPPHGTTSPRTRSRGSRRALQSARGASRGACSSYSRIVGRMTPSICVIPSPNSAFTPVHRAPQFLSSTATSEHSAFSVMNVLANEPQPYFMGSPKLHDFAKFLIDTMIPAADTAFTTHEQSSQPQKQANSLYHHLTKIATILPPPFPDINSMDKVYLFASRILYDSIQWMKNTRILPSGDSSVLVGLLKKKWNIVFLLGVLQMGNKLLDNVLLMLIKHIKQVKATNEVEMNDFLAVANELTALAKHAANFRNVAGTPIEFGYLNLIALTTDAEPRAQDDVDFQSLNDQLVCAFYEYLTVEAEKAHSNGVIVFTNSQFQALLRFSKLYRLISHLDSFKVHVLIFLFFGCSFCEMSMEEVIEKLFELTDLPTYCDPIKYVMLRSSKTKEDLSPET